MRGASWAGPWDSHRESLLQTTAATMQVTPSAKHPWKQPAQASTGPGPTLLHTTASGPGAARNRCECEFCLHAVTAGGCATWSSHSFPGVRKECVCVSGEQDTCPTVRHSDWSNAKPTHKWTHSRLKPTKIKTVKKHPERILRGSTKSLLCVAGPLPPPAQRMCCRITQERIVINPVLREQKWNQILCQRWQNIPSLLVFKGSAPPNQ